MISYAKNLLLIVGVALAAEQRVFSQQPVPPPPPPPPPAPVAPVLAPPGPDLHAEVKRPHYLTPVFHLDKHQKKIYANNLAYIKKEWHEDVSDLYKVMEEKAPYVAFWMSTVQANGLREFTSDQDKKLRLNRRDIEHFINAALKYNKAYQVKKQRTIGPGSYLKTEYKRAFMYPRMLYMELASDNGYSELDLPEPGYLDHYGFKYARETLHINLAKALEAAICKRDDSTMDRFADRQKVLSLWR